MINTGELGDRLDTLLHSWPRQTMRNMLYLNTGTGRFLETAFLSGVAQTDWTWAVKLADFDNDGRVDLFVTNGVSRNFTDADAPFTTEMLHRPHRLGPAPQCSRRGRKKTSPTAMWTGCGSRTSRRPGALITWA